VRTMNNRYSPHTVALIAPS